MSRIEEKFRQRGTKRASLIPFLNAGDPTQDVSRAAFLAAIQNGADIVEIGVPYSDPLADGPVIQASALRSLDAGFSLPRSFELTADLRQQTNAALILFTYVNPILQYGLEKFFSDAKAAGADGTIIPDLPFEESAPVLEVADAMGIDLVPLIAPTSGRERIGSICQQARGFVYCVSSLGVTGERARLSEKLRDMVDIAREHTSLAIAVGFGVSGPEQANQLADFADGVVVGSAYVRRVENAIHSTNGSQDSAMLQGKVVDSVSTFTKELCDAIQ